MLSANFKKSLLLASSVLISLTISNAEAKPLNLYDASNANAKIIGTIDSSKPMVPIFTSKEGDWMKVGNPDNGNVGWVKSSELSSNSGTGFSFSQQTIDTAKGPKTTIQFGTPQPLSEDQIKDMQMRQMKLQESIQKMNEDMQKAYANLPAGVPVFMPVIMMPAVQFTPPKSVPPVKASTAEPAANVPARPAAPTPKTPAQ